MADEVSTPNGFMRAYAVPLAIIWASLAIGVGYNTWRAHEAYFEAQQMDQKINILHEQWDKTEKRLNRRINYQKSYMDKRFNAIENDREK
jgi:hypothetical protein